ncbi:hypothetical protein [Methylomonas sp. MK1]|uniref:hypothetical protein n=1 Tax=Methylomonas sp. MK1 TaxID=1131552 RepID=UPI00126924BD|nr:hypothetical protein [Methylomonas sp. MK1]
MRKVTFFTLGAILGVAFCFLLLYVTGSVLEHFHIRLYESELDQQRNFNLFLLASSAFAIVSGYFFAKRFS